MNPDPHQAAAFLQPMPVAYIAKRSGAWSELLSIYGDSGELGEVRRSADWSAVPTNQDAIRIAIVYEGGVANIRWATDRWLARYGGKYAGHDYLVGYDGDDMSTVRTGYAYAGDSGFQVK